MQRLYPGRQQPLSAGTWNGFVDTAERFKRGGELGTPKGENVARIFTDLVDVKNNTGTDRAAGDVVEISDRLLDVLTNTHPWFSGAMPDGTRVFGILRQPLPIGKIGKCQITGVVKAKVHVQDLGHKFAVVEDGETVLQSAAQGSVRLMGMEAGALPEGGEEREMIVELGIAHDVFIGEAELAADLSPGDEEATLTGFVGWREGPCVIMPATDPSTAKNRYKSRGTTGDKVVIAYNSDPEVVDWIVLSGPGGGSVTVCEITDCAGTTCGDSESEEEPPVLDPVSRLMFGPGLSLGAVTDGKVQIKGNFVVNGEVVHTLTFNVGCFKVEIADCEATIGFDDSGSNPLSVPTLIECVDGELQVTTKTIHLPACINVTEDE